MKEYVLSPEEVELYRGDVLLGQSTGKEGTLLLTNINIVFMKKRIGLFSDSIADIEVYPVENIKVYNGVPQIKHNKCDVEVFLLDCKKEIYFFSSKEMHKFINAACERITGQSVSERGAKKINNAINMVDEALGVNTVGSVVNFFEKGAKRALFGGFVQRKEQEADANKSSSNLPAKSSTTYEEQVEIVKKLKELLDAGIITNEEFERKKREVLGL